MRINHNLSALNTYGNLTNTGAQQAKSMEKLSSGLRINRAGDDAAGLAIATNLEAQTRGIRQATRNANDGIALVQTAEGGLEETSNILIRMRELTIQAASDTVGEHERGLLQKEFDQLTQEVDRIAMSTTFNGTPILKGDSGKGTLDFHVGATAEETNKIQFDADDTNVTAGNIGIEGISVETKESANDAIQYIDDGIKNVSSYRANLGAIQSRLQSTVANLEVQALNQDSARSNIQDVDIAESTAKLASSQVVKSAGLATLAQANKIPNSALGLL